MKTFSYLFVAIYSISLILVLLAYINPRFFILEMIISATPHITALLFISIIIILTLTFGFSGKYNFIKEFNAFLMILLTISALLMFTLGYKVYEHSFVKVETETAQAKSKLKIALFNLKRENDNYKEISSEIENTNVDIVGLVEFAPWHKENIGILQKYPYSVTNPMDGYYGLAIYSKFPLEEVKSEDLIVYLEAIADIDGEKVNIIVSHPAAPFNQEMNEKAYYGLELLSKRANQLTSQNVILMGDFNLTPWSKKYSNFANSVPSLKNISKGEGIKFSWLGNLLIDHVFISKSIKASNFEIKGNSGSDHNLVYAEIRI